LSGASLLVASLLTRFGIFDGGVASAKDPKYTVLPQRERIEKRRAEQAEADDSPELGGPVGLGGP
jgi:hypothetical protein